MEKPVCKLSGTNGNAFSVIGNVLQVLRRAGQQDRVKEFTDKAFKAGSYDELLQLCFDYIEVE